MVGEKRIIKPVLITPIEELKPILLNTKPGEAWYV